ncbi:hypothetical protein DC58_16240 [Vibrio navarrensis]|uniref:helix-turn-helix transcriptional regulator n=1 Tax=Vibrio navarrensis TaxID=29495 RepID=UPI00052DEA0A|nr:LuxR C-terminal-related transcriptional regulator [Vibrio navarrensis]KGK21516.1 hypothetical protein DC58_16240 [Vibrio navarrensis]
MVSPVIISGAESLAEFRFNNGPQAMLEMLAQHHYVLNDWMVGVGKSYQLDQLTTLALESNVYDCVIVSAPTRKILEEREPLQSPPADIKVVNIQPRPSKLCGETRDLSWKDYERRNLGMLGKKHICALCPNKDKCFWPDQYGKNLDGAKIVYATQSHFVRNPYFIQHIVTMAKASNALVIFDEANVSLNHYSRTISPISIEQTLEAVQESRLSDYIKGALTHYLECLRQASTEELRDISAWRCPAIFPDQMTQITSIGDRMFGDRFINILYDLQSFGASEAESREKLADGSIHFPAPPVNAGFDTVLYSGTTYPDILKLKLGMDFYSPYSHIEFRGKSTVWHNIASSIGTATNFKKNSPQILDTFAQLTLQRVREGKRVLLVSKQKHVDHCVSMLNQYLAEEGVRDVRVVPASAYAECDDMTLVPMIHYGVIGINQFEEFDCCYCLNSYYVTQDILNNAIQELRAEDERIDVAIASTDNPRRRHGVITDQKYRYSDVAKVVNPMLQTLEMGVVIQAIGRVRPFTKSREIITFQNNDAPKSGYDHEYSNLEQLRKHFGLKSKQSRTSATLSEQINQMIADGFKQQEIASTLGISTRTVRRHKAV